MIVDHPFFPTHPTSTTPIQHLSEIVSSITEFVAGRSHAQPVSRPIHASSECHAGLRSRKPKKRRSVATTDRLAASLLPTAASSGDVFIKIFERLRDPKLRTFKYIFILVCICLSVALIVIHK